MRALAFLLASVAATSGAAEPAVHYRRLCASCHGDSGNGRGPAAPHVAGHPRDFTRGEYKFRSTPSGSLPLDADIERTIRRGVPGTSMPAWNDLPADDVRGLVSVLRSFSSRFTNEQPAAAIRVPAPPALDAALRDEGRRVWDLLRCAECHGSRGRGDGPAARTLLDGTGRPIRPADFTVGVYKSGSNPAAVYRTFMTGLDGTPMPSYADTLADQRSRWALVAYVLRLGRRPSVLDWLLDDPIVSRWR